MLALKRTLWILFFISLLLLVVTSVAERSYASRAQLVQRMKVSEEARLFGDVGEPIGSPQMMIIDDPKAFMEETGPGGVRFVDEGYMEENGVYPLQLQTVEFIARSTRLGLWIAAALCLLAAWGVGVRLKSSS